MFVNVNPRLFPAACLLLPLALLACSDDAVNDSADAATMDSGEHDAGVVDLGADAAAADAGGMGDAAIDASASSDASIDAAAVVVPPEYLQYWTGDWGDLILRQVGDEVWGVYNHDEGTIRGTFVGSTFTGWWTEVPSRMPPSDAGDVVLEFIANGDGTFHVDGRWRYASELPDGAFRENWDLTNVAATEPDPALVARFDDASLFIAHP